MRAGDRCGAWLRLAAKEFKITVMSFLASRRGLSLRSSAWRGLSRVEAPRVHCCRQRLAKQPRRSQGEPYVVRAPDQRRVLTCAKLACAPARFPARPESPSADGKTPHPRDTDGKLHPPETTVLHA